MDTNTVEPGPIVLDLVPDIDTEIPQRGEFVPCDAMSKKIGPCRQRSYFFYLLNMGSLLSYCAHHAHEYHEKLDPISSRYFDYSDDLIENRLKGEA